MRHNEARPGDLSLMFRKNLQEGPEKKLHKKINQHTNEHTSIIRNTYGEVLKSLRGTRASGVKLCRSLCCRCVYVSDDKLLPVSRRRAGWKEAGADLSLEIIVFDVLSSWFMNYQQRRERAGERKKSSNVSQPMLTGLKCFVEFTTIKVLERQRNSFYFGIVVQQLIESLKTSADFLQDIK